MASRRKKSIKKIVTAGVLFLCAGWVILEVCSHGGWHLVAAFHPGEATEIRILEECEWMRFHEGTCAVACEIRRNGVVVAPMRPVGSRWHGDSTAYDFTAAGDIIVVTEEANPDVVLVLYDLVSGGCWPHQGRREDYLALRERGRRLLGRVNRARPSMDYKLAGEAEGGRGWGGIGSRE